MANEFPVPVRDGDTETYWDGVDNHELRIQKCTECHQHIFYPRSICPHCFSEQLEWVRASGHGRIYSYTVVHRPFGPFVSQAPFVVGIVELDEGVRMMTRILGPREEIAIEKCVQVTFVQSEAGVTLPYFEVTGE